jgi:hypothetical protein
MGLVISSHGLSDELLRSLIMEYRTQSLKMVEECWQNFADEVRSTRCLDYAQFDEVFGRLVQDSEPHFQARSKYFMKLHALILTSNISILQLFQKSQEGKPVPVVCGYEVFIGICLALKVDIKLKLKFLFQMYLNEDNDTSKYATHSTHPLVENFYGLRIIFVNAYYRDSRQHETCHLPRLHECSDENASSF